MKKTTSSLLMIATAVSLGGFLFGFDAAVISGVTKFITAEFDLNEIQLGWAVASLTFTSTIAMFFAGPISDRFGRKKVLVVVALMYALSALFSAIAPTFAILVAARMLGGFAVGASLILAPMYIAEISPADRRGKMVSINQLNIVLGFSAAYFANYYLLSLSESGADWVQNLGIASHTWRWMLGLELLPALMYFFALFLVPESPRWLLLKNKDEEAEAIIRRFHGSVAASAEITEIRESIHQSKQMPKSGLKDLFKPALRLVLIVGVMVGILQQITGVNAIYFYATFIFEQSGIGTEASFSQAVWIGIINVVFTLIAMAVIDKMGRKPLLLIGTAGIAISMFLTSFGFYQATYTLSQSALENLPPELDSSKLFTLVDKTYDTDVPFKKAIKAALGNQDAAKYEAAIIQQAITMNPVLVLIGILGFVASFAISLGPVMWVLLSELYPNWIRGVAISFVGFVNSVTSYLVQQFFPWELANMGSAAAYAIFAIFAVIGFFLIIKIVPETKGKTLEEIETEFVKS